MTTYPAAVLADGPLAFWRLNEAITPGGPVPDSSGHGRDMTQLGNEVECVSQVPGLLADPTSRAMRFTRVAGAVNGPQLGFSDWMATDYWTWEALLKVEANVGGYQCVMARDDNGSALVTRVDLTPDLHVRWIWNKGGSYYSVNSSEALIVDQTYHVVATVDGSYARIYLNAAQVAEQTTSGVLVKWGQVATLGRLTTGSDRSGLKGVLEEVACYDYALTPAQVLAHYTAATAAPAVAPNQPTGLTVTPNVTTAVLTWSAPAGGTPPTGYDVRVNGGAVTTVTATTATLTGLTPATTYLFEVRSHADAGVSAWVSVSGTTATPTPPDTRWWTHRLAAALGLDPVADQPLVQVHVWNAAGWVPDDALSHALIGYTVTYGRREVGTRADPITATLVFASPRLPVPPPIATRLRVTLSAAATAALGLATGARFTGEVTDPTVDHDARTTTLVCAGRLGRAYRMPVDGTGWPAEDDGARMARILAATAIGLDVGTIDPGASGALAVPAQLETAATLVDQVAASSLGQLIEQPDGSIDWHDADHRRGAPAAATLASSEVLRRVSWTQRLASLLNRVDVKTAAGAVLTVEDTESSDPGRYGPWPGSLDTILLDPIEARETGVEILSRRADPSWQLPDLTVNLLRTLDPTNLTDVLELRYGSRLDLTGLPDDFPNDGRTFVEGYVETATPRSWSLAVTVSDPTQSGVGIRWVDVPDTDAYQWTDVAFDISWFDVARVDDPAGML